MLALFALLYSAQPAAAITKEYQVKLAYLYKFALYVTWPEGDAQGDLLVIGIMGPDPFGAALERVAEKKPNGKSVVVKHFSSWADFEPCHILFISRSTPPDSLVNIAKRLAGQPVLTVGDSLGASFPDVIFDFYLDAEGRVGIRMNVDAANRRGLRADARLMQVCDIVGDTNK